MSRLCDMEEGDRIRGRDGRRRVRKRREGRKREGRRRARWRLEGKDIIKSISTWIPKRAVMLIKYVDGEVSNRKSVLRGVPQRSVLGPLLFLLYMNDLDDDITSNVLKFMDHTYLFR